MSPDNSTSGAPVPELETEIAAPADNGLRRASETVKSNCFVEPTATLKFVSGLEIIGTPERIKDCYAVAILFQSDGAN